MFFFPLIIQVFGPLIYSDYLTVSNQNWQERSSRPNGNHIKYAVVGDELVMANTSAKVPLPLNHETGLISSRCACFS